MAGEMLSINPVTGIDDEGQEWFFHAAVAKELGGKVMPFDKHQGPYVLTCKSKLWLISDEQFPAALCRWYNEANGKTSSPFMEGKSKSQIWLAVDAAREVL